MNRTILRKMRSRESSWRQSRKVIIEKAQAGPGTAILFLLHNQQARSLNEESGSLETGCGILLVGDGSIKANSLGFGIIDRKSTRLNSSHANISYAVFCLKKKKA